MYFLSFETSTKIFSLALNKDEKLLRFRNLKSASVLEDSILPTVDKVLGSAGVSFDQIDAFAIALGPGSFTSLRVGLSTIKAFAMSTTKPVVGIPSLDIIAKAIGDSKSLCHFRESGNQFKEFDEICVLTDARRGKLYTCIYALKGQILQRKSEYLLTTPEDILDKVHGRTLFVGDGLSLYRTAIEESYKKHSSKKVSTCKCLFAPDKYWHPQARVMASIAYERLKNKKYDNAANLLPIYLYPQDCQVTR